MKKLEPVTDWKRGWRWLSVQANVGAQGILLYWIFLRDQPLPTWAMGLLWAVLVVGFVGRFFVKVPR